MVFFDRVGPAYFEAMGATLLAAEAALDAAVSSHPPPG